MPLGPAESEQFELAELELALVQAETDLAKLKEGGTSLAAIGATEDAVEALREAQQMEALLEEELLLERGLPLLKGPEGFGRLRPAEPSTWEEPPAHDPASPSCATRGQVCFDRTVRTMASYGITDREQDGVSQAIRCWRRTAHGALTSSHTVHLPRGALLV